MGSNSSFQCVGWIFFSEHMYVCISTPLTIYIMKRVRLLGHKATHFNKPTWPWKLFFTWGFQLFWSSLEHMLSKKLENTHFLSPWFIPRLLWLVRLADMSRFQQHNGSPERCVSLHGSGSRWPLLSLEVMHWLDPLCSGSVNYHFTIMFFNPQVLSLLMSLLSLI